MKYHVLPVMAAVLLSCSFTPSVFAADGETFSQAVARQMDDIAAAQAAGQYEKWKVENPICKRVARGGAAAAVAAASACALPYAAAEAREHYLGSELVPAVLIATPVSCIIAAAEEAGNQIGWVRLIREKYKARKQLNANVNMEFFNVIAGGVQDESVPLSCLIEYRDALQSMHRELKRFEFTRNQKKEFDSVYDQVRDRLQDAIRGERLGDDD